MIYHLDFAPQFQRNFKRLTKKQGRPYGLEVRGDEREITRGLIRLSQQALSKYVDKEPDID